MAPKRTALAALLLCGPCLGAVPAAAQTLQDTLVSAYRTNPQLQADRARQRSVDDDVSRAWGGYRPQVVASASAGRAQDKITYPSSFEGLPPTKFNEVRSPNTESVQLTQPIWDGNRTLADVKHSKWAVATGLATLVSTEQTVLGDAVQAYYDLYRDQQILDIQKTYVKSLEDEKRGVEARYAVKDVTQTDVAQSDARLARGIADQQQFEGNVESSRSAFIRAVGFAPGVLPKPPALPATVPGSQAEALALAEQNPDLQAAIYTQKAAEADVEFAESGLLPNVAVQATSFRAEHTDQNLSNNLTNQITVNLNIPLYDGGVASARTRSAKHIAGQRRLQIDQQRDAVVDQVNRSWETLLATRARITSLRRNLQAAEVALRGVQQELRVGSRTVLDELNARQELLDTQIQLLRSEHDEAITAYTLLVASGKLTAEALDLPVERYDPKVHYDAVRALPWGPWIGTDYPESPKVNYPQ